MSDPRGKPASVPALGDPRLDALKALRTTPPEPQMQPPAGSKQGPSPRPQLPERERVLANIALLHGLGVIPEESEPLRRLQGRLREIDTPTAKKNGWAMWAIALAIAIDALVRLLRP